MLQTIFIGVLLLGASAYIGWLIYRSFTSTSCESGCGKCSSLDVDAIVKSIEEKKVST